MKDNKAIDWFLRGLKGILIGTGFILPGVSGGALAAIFGLYERMVSFVAHIKRDFKKNILFFLPVGIGMLAGIVLLSYPLSFFLEHYAAPTMWCFIGCIIGTFPSLWGQAGRKGRSTKHMVIMIIALAAGFAFLQFGSRLFGSNVPQNTGTWILAGAIIAMGVLVPGLSPSNFLLYMGMYGSMITAFKSLDILVLLPIGIGALTCMLLLSKAVDRLFQVAYAGLFHIILGVVIASTLMIIPFDFNYLSIGGLVCVLTCGLGIGLGYWMSKLEDRYKPEKAVITRQTG